MRIHGEPNATLGSSGKQYEGKDAAATARLHHGDDTWIIGELPATDHFAFHRSAARYDMP